MKWLRQNGLSKQYFALSFVFALFIRERVSVESQLIAIVWNASTSLISVSRKNVKNFQKNAIDIACPVVYCHWHLFLCIFISLFYSNCDALSFILRLQIDVYDKYQSADAVLIIFRACLIFIPGATSAFALAFNLWIFIRNQYLFLVRVSW